MKAFVVFNTYLNPFGVAKCMGDDVFSFIAIIVCSLLLAIFKSLLLLPLSLALSSKLPIGILLEWFIYR